MDRQAETIAPTGGCYSLRTVLAVVFGTLVALAVGLVLAMSVASNLRNTFSLLNDQAVNLLASMEHEIKRNTEPVSETVSTLAALYEKRQFHPAFTAAYEPVLSVLLRMNKAAEAIIVLDEAGNAVTVERGDNGALTFNADNAIPARTMAAFREAATRAPGSPAWGEPVRIGDAQFHYAATALTRNGRMEGIAVALVGRQSINRIVAELGRQYDTTAFVLVGKNKVIAHSHQLQEFATGPVIPLEQFPDEDLAGFASAELSDEFEEASESGVQVYETPGRSGLVYITTALTGYAPEPYTLGAYFRKADIGEEVFRAFATLLAGIAGLIVAVIAAILIGKRISMPMTRIADTAAKFSDFRIDEITPLPKSRIKEINDQAHALNKLHVAMREFSRYVPRSVVAGLIASGSEAASPRKREITILFTDIVDFTGMSERLDAHDTAQLLSEHFDAIGAQIESRNGTVDKFMGDGLMAFWGAPEENPNHVTDAVEAAKGIAETLERQNATRRAKGLPALRMRIGIHTGPAVVGNVGGATRQNYTIVGDSVNVAQRLEQLGKEMFEPGETVVAIVSGEVSDKAAEHANFVPAGTRVIRGRERPIAVCKMLLKDEHGAKKVVAFPGASTA